MRLRLALIAALAILVWLPVGLADEQLMKLKCVDKIGDNMYRAEDRTVVWTQYCGHEAKCESAEVRRGSDARITWRDGSYCWVINVAPPTGTRSKKRR